MAAFVAPAAVPAHVVGAGPNGIAAAIRLAEAGLPVTLWERDSDVGGALRSGAATLPGFVHDLGAAVLPLAVASPAFARLPPAAHGLRWLHPPFPLAHPLEDGRAAVLQRSIAVTAAGLGPDADAYLRLLYPLVADAGFLVRWLLRPLRPTRELEPALRFGLLGARSAAGLWRARFRSEPARALFAGLSAHSFLRLDAPASAAYGLLLALLAHVGGWPFAAGGSQSVADALAAHLRRLGGRIVVDREIVDLAPFPDDALLLFDTAPRDLARIAGDRLPAFTRDRLARHRYGAAVFKVDWAIDGPIPWTADACRQAGTIHLGGDAEEIAASEREVVGGRAPLRPFVLLAQPSIVDPSRAPAGRQAVWAYCHVPLGCDVDMADRIEAQVERFAPGFRDRILARRAWSPRELERLNPNLVGGAISGGVGDLRGLLLQNVALPSPYAAFDPRIFLCSASVPPGGGVHGMCGHLAAEDALRRLLRASGRV